MEDVKNSVVEEDSVIIGSDKDSEVSIGVLATDGTADTEELISRDITNAISRDVISNVNLERVEGLVSCAAYLVDFSCGDVTVIGSWLQSLKSFIVSNEYNGISEAMAQKNVEREQTGKFALRADAALYFKTKSGLSLVGYVDQLQMYRCIRDYIFVSFGDRVKVYYKKDGADKFSLWKNTDISGARLRL